MKIINIFTSKTIIPAYMVYPIRYCRKRLLDRGYNINFYYKPVKKMFSCDTLLLLSKPILEYVKEKKIIIESPSPTIDLLLMARKYTNKIIWMDTSDSTGVTHFELLPYVDLYLKKQLYKDKSFYSKEFYGGRIFSDFYHENFGISDSSIFQQYFPLQKEFEHKIGLSWNIGLGNMFNAFDRFSELRLKFPRIFDNGYNIRFYSTSIDRPIDIFIRTTTNLNRETIAFHRKEMIKRLDEIIKENNLIGSTRGKWLSNKEFIQYMKQTKTMPSPFGWGELGVRDYESFIYGSALLKPDMSFMETWPSIFNAGETYQSINLSFNNLKSAILELLEDDNKRIQIAKNGQEAYRNSISPEGMERFCDWFIQQIEK